MKLFWSRGKSHKQHGEHSYRFRHKSLLVRHWWDFFRACPTVFEVDISDFSNPCHEWARRHLFNPGLVQIADQDFWFWLLQTDLPGKVKVDFCFAAWYSTFMHEDPRDGKLERGTLRIAFSNKAAAMMFKIHFACPKLKTIQVAHS